MELCDCDTVLQTSLVLLGLEESAWLCLDGVIFGLELN